jgi:transcriptional regulator with XRE-family HTH domain
VAKRQQLAQARRSRGLSQEALAERLGIDPRTVGRWESGESEPQPWLRPKLARALHVVPGQLDELLAAMSDYSHGDRLNTALERPSGTDLVAVAHLRDHVRRLDADYDRAPSTSLLPQTGQCLGQAYFLRNHARSNVVRRELRVVETETATLMGQLVWDASQRRDHATAHGYFDRALSSARELGDPVAESRALLRKSFVALYGEKSATKGSCSRCEPPRSRNPAATS